MSFIDKAAFLDELSREYVGDEPRRKYAHFAPDDLHCVENVLSVVEGVANTMPVADVAPVVHAKLKVIERRGDKVVLVQCSACNGYSRDGLYVLYCPHCGAIMDWL